MSDHLEQRDAPDAHEGPYDKHEPNSKAIAFWAVVSAISLAALVPVFNWYFNTLADGEFSQKVWAPDADDNGQVDYLAEREQQRAVQREAIQGGIEGAIEQLATRGRQLPQVRPMRNDGLEQELPAAVATLDAVAGWDPVKNDSARARARRALEDRRARDEAARQAAEAAEAAAAAAAAAEAEAAANPRARVGMAPRPAQ